MINFIILLKLTEIVHIVKIRIETLNKVMTIIPQWTFLFSRKSFKRNVCLNLRRLYRWNHIFGQHLYWISYWKLRKNMLITVIIKITKVRGNLSVDANSKWLTKPTMRTMYRASLCIEFLRNFYNKYLISIPF